MRASFFQATAGAIVVLLALVSPTAMAAKPAYYYFCVEHPNTRPQPEITTIFVWVEPDNFKPYYWDYPNGWFHARGQKRYMPTSGNGWCRGGGTLEKVQEEWASYYVKNAWTPTRDDTWIKAGQRVRPDPLEDKQLLDRLVRKAKGEAEAAAAKAQAKPDAKTQAAASKPSAPLTIDDSYAKEQAKYRKEHEERMKAGAQRDAAAKAKADAATADLAAQQQREIMTRKMASKPCATPGCASKQ